VGTKPNDVDYNTLSYALDLLTANERTHTSQPDFSPVTHTISKFPTPDFDENVFLLLFAGLSNSGFHNQVSLLYVSHYFPQAAKTAQSIKWLGYWLGDSTFDFLQNVQTSSEAHQACYSMRIAEVKQHGGEAGHLPPLSTEVSKEWNAPLLPHAFIACQGRL